MPSITTERIIKMRLPGIRSPRYPPRIREKVVANTNIDVKLPAFTGVNL